MHKKGKKGKKMNRMNNAMELVEKRNKVRWIQWKRNDFPWKGMRAGIRLCTRVRDDLVVCVRWLVCVCVLVCQ